MRTDAVLLLVSRVADKFLGRIASTQCTDVAYLLLQMSHETGRYVCVLGTRVS